ncbi:MAG TPA: response regulator [Selenomonadales bacterium]|nr:response regulator [Selenomonadales bacterium]
MEMVISVVILEDDPMVLELHRQYVDRVKNFELSGCAMNGKEGAGLIERVRPHLAIVDIYMPGLSGLQLLQQIRASGWNTDVILVTAAHDTESVQKGIQYGAVDYIVKPFTFLRFKKALDSYRHYFAKLRSEGTFLSQSDIDMLRGSGDSRPECGGLPKGMQQNTLDTIVEYIRHKNNYFTIREIAESLGISRVTIGRYLGYLCKTGCLKEVLSYGPKGRPLQKYLVQKELLN